jgi:AraC-like DNA-binding protein
MPVFVAQRSIDDSHSSRRLPVTHSFAALAFYTGGQACVQQRGRWLLEQGDVLLVPAGEPHQLLEAQEAEIWGLGFCVPCFAADDAGLLLEPFERVRSGASPTVRIPSERHAFLLELFRELQDTSRSRRDGEPHAVQRSLLTLILNEIRRASWGDANTSKQKSVVANSLSFIERNCLRSLTLKDVAAAVKRSPAYVTTALTRATGRSAVEWIIAGRRAEARRLLLHSDERVDAVAERIGYADSTHFIRLFQREHGATPAAWRAAKSRSR